jgi:hypothetical protein
LSGLPSSGIRELAAYPLQGPIQAFEFWSNEPVDLLMVVGYLSICVAFAVRLYRSRQILAWASAPALLIASILSLSVWRFPYDIGRVLTPVFLAYPFLAFVTERRPVTSAERSLEPTA